MTDDFFISKIKTRSIKIMDIIFESKEHENFFYENLDKSGVKDEYHKAFFYVMGISNGTRQNINKLFDFKEDRIKPKGLYDAWQTGSSIKVCLLAFNLWGGYHDGDGGGYTTPDSLFACNYAKYFVEGIKLRHPSYFS